MGISITKQGDYDFWYVHPVTGKRTKKRILKDDGSRPKDMKDAEKLIASFRREVEELDGIRTRERAVLEVAQARQLIASATHRLSDLFDKFSKSTKFPSSDGRRKYAKMVIEKFVVWCEGQNIVSITDVSTAKCQEYIDKVLDGLAADTKKKHLILLATAFKVVGKEIGMSSSPWDDVKKPVVARVSRKDYSIEQVEQICGCFESWFTDENDKTYVPEHNDQLYVTFLLGLYAGCRMKDACLMRWEQVDFDHATITYTPSKTSKSSGKQVVLPIIEGREKDWLIKAKEWKDDSGYVCPAVAAMYLKSNVTVSRIFIRCFQLATGVVNRYDGATGKARSLYGFHALRHTCASLLANAGVDLTTIAEIIGHRSTTMTQVYSHISAKHQAEEMQRAFGKGGTVKTAIIKELDRLNERQLKQVLQYIKYM